MQTPPVNLTKSIGTSLEEVEGMPGTRSLEDGIDNEVHHRQKAVVGEEVKRAS
jgi:hypothetical protein